MPRTNSKATRRMVRSKPITRKPNSNRQTMALTKITVPVTPQRPWELDNEQITILKNSIAKGASDEELKYCLTVARRYKADPFKRQIWFIKRWDSGADNGQGARGAFVWTPQLGIDGLLFISARDHKDFGSVSLPEYGPMHVPDGQKFSAPEWARVKVWKKGESEPTEAQAWWDEYAPSDLSKAPFWRKMPRRMIAKCATALALRQAYPDLGGLYIPEECEKMNEEFTPSGRRIVEQPTSGTHEAAQKVLEAKLAGAMPLHSAEEPKASPAPAAERHSPSGKLSETAYHRENVPPAVKQEPWKYAGAIEFDYSEDPTMPYLRGDISELVASFPADLTLKRRNDWFCCFAEDAERVKALCRERNFEIKTVGAPTKVPVLSGKTTTAGRGGRTSAESAAPVVVKGTIEQANPESGKSPRVSVLLKVDRAKHWMSAFDQKLFAHLIAGKGQEAELFIVKNAKGDKTYTNVVGLKRIGRTEFEDGHVPVIQRASQEPGRTLF